MKDAVDIAAGTDALDDLLPEIAALGEVEGASLGGLLREFAVADVGAVEGCSFEQTEPVAALLFGEGCAYFEEGFGEIGCGGNVGPKFEVRNQRAVGVDYSDSRRVPGQRVTLQLFERCDVQADLLQQGCGLGAGEDQAGLSAGDVGELDVVHDDEAVEECHQDGELGGGCFDEEGVGFGEDVGIALDASLDTEDEVVAAVAGLEILDGVGHHAVEPADAVLSGDANPACVIEGGDASSCEEVGELGRWGGDGFGMGRGGHEGHSGRRGELCVHLIITVDCEVEFAARSLRIG